jgi:hypothetical protein
MSALNFPANPDDQDVYEGYVFDASIGVWNRVSSTAPIPGGTADDNAIFKATLFFGGN